MQYKLVQNTSTWLIVFIAIAGVAMFVQLFIQAYWTRYRHQQSPKQADNKVLSQPSTLELPVVKLEPQHSAYYESQTPIDSAIKRRPFWYSIG